MTHIYLCKEHYKNLWNQVFTADERECKFCLSELRERMEKFGIVDWKSEYEKEKDKMTSGDFLDFFADDGAGAPTPAPPPGPVTSLITLTSLKNSQ